MAGYLLVMAVPIVCWQCCGALIPPVFFFFFLPPAILVLYCPVNVGCMAIGGCSLLEFSLCVCV